ncbi:PREDICTED: fractalkine-like isoform X1 [Lepidothrix coronata]|uniref:Fractalkine-like isoform X1 n=1 Tax=Lepidothrix coronata TaxID=321398 RepID=A0A6J0I1Q6_9PASS|nr:PREDICTED: fractalkine-like isoform X1 [Lepidothrix coronata]XP_017679774.1 PREDICTED: fractalkine-like isoform X1 [Lepidothrix coronata]
MKAVSVQILLVLRALCLVTLAGGQPKAPLKCSNECSGFTSVIAEKRIRSYRRTEPGCTKQAIILTTLKSKEFCADPEAEWVKKIVKKLDQKKATASPLGHDATSPEEAGDVQKQVGLPVRAPSQAIAPTGFFQGTTTTAWERIHAPTARTEVSSKSPPARQDSTQLPAGSPSVTQEYAARSEVAPEANRDSSNSPASSTALTAGMGSSQPTPHPTARVHGFYNTMRSTEECAGHTANAAADVQDTTSPDSDSDPMATTKGSDKPLLSTSESLDSTTARANAPDTASSSSRSDLPSTLDSVDIATPPDTPIPPDTSSVSTLNSTIATDKGASVHSNKVVGSSTDGSGTRTRDYSSPVGKQEPSDTLVFAGQAFSGQARVQTITDRPDDQPLSSFLSQTHFVIPVSVVSAVTICTVALVWLYLKFGMRPEESSREMVQGLLYQRAGHQNNAYPMEVI